MSSETLVKPINIFQYSNQQHEEFSLSEDELSSIHVSENQKLWINIHGVDDSSKIQAICQQFNLHPLVIEDIQHTNQRAKVDEYEDYLYIVVRCFNYNKTTHKLSTEQISFVLGKHFLLTFQQRSTGTFNPIREKLRSNTSRLKSFGVDALSYALLDVVVDRYFQVLDDINQEAESLENALLRKPKRNQLAKIHQLKITAILIRRAAWPLREMLSTLIRDESKFFAPTTIIYLRDVYDHTVHFIESLESIRDMLAGMMDLYLSSISNQLNIELRTLTVVTMLFMPATLITGIFGMNFDVMPLLKNVQGFWYIIISMIVVASIMGYIFWRKHWLENQKQ